MHKVWLLVALIAMPAFAGESTLALRHRSEVSSPNLVDGIALTTVRPLGWLDVDVGARLSMSYEALEAIDYKGEARVPLLSWLNVGARLFHSNRTAEGTALSQWFLFTSFSGMPLSFLGAGFTFGWQQRYYVFRGNFGLPLYTNADFHDGDIAARIAIYVKPAERWLTTIAISTIEELDVFNLNSPFAQLTVDYRPNLDAWSFFAFSRYRVLLGFGRRDELAVGVGLRISAKPPEIASLRSQ